MIITVDTLHRLEACYVNESADDDQRAAVARLPAHIADIASWDDVPLGDVVWLVARVAPDVARRWALWCAGRSLRHWKAKFPTDTTVRDLLRTTALHLRGKATREELEAAADAAYAATYATATATYATATYAAYYAAAAAADAAAYATADAAAYATAAANATAAYAYYAANATATAAYASERARQRARLVSMLRRLPAPRAP